MDLSQIDLKETIAAIGVLTAFVTAIVSLLTIRWSRQAFSAKDAQIAQLQEQIKTWKDLSPAEMHKQALAIKEMMGNEVKRLEQALTESNDLLRRRSAEISEEKRAVATLTGWGKVFFGIDDSELAIRRLHSLLFNGPGRPINYGELQLTVTSFYVQAVRLFIASEENTRRLVQSGPEWVLDYLLHPLLFCMQFYTLRALARDLASLVCDVMEQTPFAYEVPVYRKALERAEGGEIFKGTLPADLKVDLWKAKGTD